MKKISLALILTIMTINLASAVIISSVQIDPLAPGEKALIRIEVDNILNNDAEDVSLSLQFTNLPFIPVGTSEESIDKLDKGDEEDFLFKVKSAPDISPGDYEIPYTLKYTLTNEDIERTSIGTLGISVKANPDLVFSITSDNAILNRQGTISLKVINKGFADARFVSIRVIPEDFIILSDNEEYIGTVDSDDFETANFDVKFDKEDAAFIAIVEYIDFDNKKVIENINLPLNIYTEKEALELGIIKPNRTLTYIVSAITLMLVFILWRTIKKKQRLKRSMRNSGR